MTETAEREMELVAGVIGGITQKKADTWTVAVTPEGSQYAKNLWTKDADLVESLKTKIGQEGAFVCGASYWTLDGKQVRSLWITQEGTEGVTIEKPPERVATPAAAPKAAAPRQYAPDLKDRMIVRQTALKAAAELYAESAMVPDGDLPLAVMKAAQRFEQWVYRDIDPPPFAPDLSEHDAGIPF